MTRCRFLHRMMFLAIVVTLLVSCSPGQAQPATATAAPPQTSAPTAVPPTGTPPVLVQLKQGGVLITPDSAARVERLGTIEGYKGKVMSVAFQEMDLSPHPIGTKSKKGCGKGKPLPLCPVGHERSCLFRNQSAGLCANDDEKPTRTYA
jgi:hypothetical protein